MSGLALLLVLFMMSRAKDEHPHGGEGHVVPIHPGILPHPAARPGARVPHPAHLPHQPRPRTLPAPAAPPVAPLPPIAQAAKKSPPPWPQAMPTGLPPWGGAGWEPDNPPPAQVQARAWQLLATLWKYGPGTRKTEQTAGRWITYQAEAMGKKREKKGVVAYRVRGGEQAAPPPPGAEPTNLV